MIWLTFRQHRMQLVATAAVVAAIGVGLLVHAVVVGNAMAGLSGDALDRLLVERVDWVYDLVAWLPVVPAMVGISWGAPVLTREAERGTHVLAWTQSVSRRRWVAAKLAVLAAAATVSGLALGATVTAWLHTFAGSEYADRLNDPGVFTTTGVAVGGWWLFAFTAMAITLVVFVVAVVGAFHVRADYATPERLVRHTSYPRVPADSILLGGDWGVPEAAGYRDILYLHPGERYWRFQWTEAGILAAGALLLAGATYRRVSRRGI
jgi:hypothetical protein